MKSFYLLVVISTLLTFPGLRAEEEIVELTSEEALRRAAQVSPRLKELREWKSAAQSSIDEVGAARWPSLDASFTYSRLSDVPELSTTLPSGQALTLFPNLPNSYQTRVQASLPIFTGFRISSQIEAAEKLSEAASREENSGRLDVGLETELAYWNLIVALETERARRDILLAYEGHARDAQNRKKVGMAAENEVLAVLVERDQAQLALIRAENDRRVSHDGLRRVLDYPPLTRLVPTETVDVPARPDGDIESLVARSYDRRPERRALQARIEASQALANADRAGYLPKLVAQAGVDYSSPNKRILPQSDEFQDSWDASLALSWNLFEGGKTKSAVERRQAEAAAYRYRLLALDQAIRHEVTARYNDLESALAAVPVANQSVGSATEGVRVTKNRYQAGLAPSSELLDAESALLRAQLGRIDTLARAHFASAALNRTIGR